MNCSGLIYLCGIPTLVGIVVIIWGIVHSGVWVDRKADRLIKELRDHEKNFDNSSR